MATGAPLEIVSVLGNLHPGFAFRAHGKEQAECTTNDRCGNSSGKDNSCATIVGLATHKKAGAVKNGSNASQGQGAYTKAIIGAPKARIISYIHE